MKRNTFAKISRSAMAFLLIFGLVAQMLPTTALAADSDFSASFIKELEDLTVDYTDYLDNSVVLQLPDGVTNDDEISVIITVDTATIMEAYEGTDKSTDNCYYPGNYRLLRFCCRYKSGNSGIYCACNGINLCHVTDAKCC